MLPLEEITEILSERGYELNREDMLRIAMLSVEVPLEDSEALAMTLEGVALIVNDPLYQGDLEPVD